MKDNLKKTLLENMRDGFMSLEDSEIVDIDSEPTLAVAACLNDKSKCNLGAFFIIEEYKMKVATCPCCKTKYSVKCFKNGKVSTKHINANFRCLL